MEVTREAVSVSAITKSEDGAAAVEGVPRSVRAPPVPSRCLQDGEVFANVEKKNQLPAGVSE